jgi:Skp family chaperone for outer membrane proteins
VLHVKVSLLGATFVAAIVGILSLAYPTADAQTPRPSGHNIAVVDVSVIFKQHQRFLAATEKFKKDVEAAEAKLKEEYNRVQALQQQLKGLNPGSPDYKQMEQRVAREYADLQIKQQSQKKDLMELEGKIYFQVYKELDDSVKLFAERNNIALVLRYASDPMDNPTDRNEIVRGINRSVVYVNPALDITTLILQDLNRSASPVSSGAAPAGPVGVGPRPNLGVQR